MNTQLLELPDGKLAYDDSGNDGPLLIMVPGMGDLRSEYRFVAPQFVAAGYRVVTVDLRGHGESSTGWPEYTVEAVGRDLLALIEHLNAGPAVIVATSFSPGAAVWAAAEKPSAISGLVLVGAFVRDAKTNTLQKAIVRVMLSNPWRVRTWDMFYKTLYPSQQPDDFAEYRQQLRDNLGQPGRFDAVKAMGLASKSEAENRLGQVQAPSLVVMGSKDPDFHPPEAEAQFIADSLKGQVVMIEGAGHYPHAEMPEKFMPVVQKFLSEVTEQNGA